MNWYCNIYLRKRETQNKFILLIYNELELEETIKEVEDRTKKDIPTLSISQLGLALDMTNIIKGIDKYKNKKYRLIRDNARSLLEVDKHLIYHTLIPESYKIEIENFEQIIFKPVDDEKEFLYDNLSIENKLLALTLFDKCIEYKINEKK